MFKTPPLTIPQNLSQTFSFPFRIPKSACAGAYTIIAKTLLNGTVIDSSTASLTVTTH